MKCTIIVWTITAAFFLFYALFCFIAYSGTVRRFLLRQIRKEYYFYDTYVYDNFQLLKIWFEL